MDQKASDRISSLPESIIHHLMSFLPTTKDVKVTSALSKKWYHFSKSFPFLDFDASRYGDKSMIAYPDGEFKYPNNRDEFLKYVGEALCWFQEKKLSILSFRISTTLDFHVRMDLFLNKWIGLVLDRGVEEFVLRTRNGNFNDDPYKLPQLVFAAETIKVANLDGCSLLGITFPNVTMQLQKLHLTGVHMDENTLRSILSNCPLIEDLSILQCPGLKRVQICHLSKLKVLVVRSCNSSYEIMTIDEINSSKLRELFLFRVHLDEQILRSIFSTCPLIEELSINMCRGIRKLQISRLYKLRSLDGLCFNDEIEMIEIDSPTLESLSFTSLRSPSLTRKIGLIKCPALINLVFKSVHVEDIWLNEYVPKLSSLRKLDLSNCQLLHRVSISSDSLRELYVSSSTNLVELEIDAPSLLSFSFWNDHMPKPLIWSKHPCGLWQAFINTGRKNTSSRVDSNFFLQLRNFISRANHFQYLEMVSDKPEITFNVEEVRDRDCEAVAEIGHLKLKIRGSSLSDTYPNVFDGLLWSCRPRIISVVVLNPHDTTNFMKFVEDIRSRLASSSACGNGRSWVDHLEVIDVSGVMKNDNVSSRSSGSDSCCEAEFKFKW